ncbi:MAG TPA: ATP-binding protein [Candidatus Limnocylindria bacterium]|nr:ATP-binding protein [Candidatus Limnocylindria bacterium]
MPERVKRLQRASLELVGSLDLDRVKQATVDAACFILNADAAALMLPGADPALLEIQAAQGLSAEYVRSQRVPRDAARRSYPTPKEPVVIDLLRGPLGDATLVRAEGLAKVLAIPLHNDGEFVGSLNAYTKDPTHEFAEEDIDLASVLAAEASVAIANAQLYQEALNQRELERTLLDSLGTAVLVARPPSVVSGLNRAARELTGLDDSAIGRPLDELFERFSTRDAATGAPLARSALTEGLRGAAVDREVVFTHLVTGDDRHAHVTIRPVRDADGAVVAATATMHDLTEVRRLQQEKEQFVSIVSHELRTPLTPLKALAQLLVSRIRRSRERKQELDLESLERNLISIERQVDRMNGLVSDLLSVSRAGRGTLEIDRRPFDLAASVRDTVERYVEATREEGRHRIVLEGPASLAITGDEARVEQMLMNLIGNAVKYSPRGGEVRVSLAQRDGAAEIVIADEGIGISAEDLPRLGSPFTRGSGRAATFAGMGIGLHVARVLAEAHGGSLVIESPGEDRGTTVRVRLPA